MLNAHIPLRPNGDEVIGKVIEGEAILINLATGSYYALPGAGALVWGGIEDHCSAEEIAARLASQYEVTLDEARADVLALAGQLVEERIALCDGDARPPADAPAVAASRKPYTPPAMNVYSDMRNLLALDPPMPTIDALGPVGGNGNGRQES